MTSQARIAGRRLRAAEGYLELGLPGFALAELEQVSEPGPLAVPVLWMTAEALKAQGRFEEAIAPLRHVTRSLPMPMSRPAWESLTECLRRSGRLASAEDAQSTLKYLELQSESSASPPRFQITIPDCGRLDVEIHSGGTLKISFEPQGGGETES